MTSEEKQKAIDALKISAPAIAVKHEEFNDYIQTLNKIMDWLEQEPTTKNGLGVDCISRQSVLDKIQRLINAEQNNIDENGDYMNYARERVNAYEAIQFFVENDCLCPSVTPQEPRWIPVSEYLPVTNDEVLVTYIVNGNAKKRYVETANCFDGEWSSVNDEYRIPNTKIEIIAWCEMPKPYKSRN